MKNLKKDEKSIKKQALFSEKMSMKLVLKTHMFCSFFLSFLLHDAFWRGAFKGRADSCNFALNEYSGKRMYWKDFPVVFYIHENVPSLAAKNFKSAVDDWNITWYNYLYQNGLEDNQQENLFKVHAGRILGEPVEDGRNILFFETDNFDPFAGKNPSLKYPSCNSGSLSNRKNKRSRYYS